MSAAIDRDRLGLTNGIGPRVGNRAAPLDNRMGRTNGLCDARHRLSGLTTVVGHVNGLTGISRGSVRIRRLLLRRNSTGIVTSSDIRRSAILFAISIVVMLGLGVFLGTPMTPQPPIVIDGNFSDWADMPYYEDPTDVGPAQVDLIGFRVFVGSDTLFVYGKTRGALFAGPSPSTVYVMAGNGSTTGYEAPGLVADLVAEFWGWNGTARQSSLRRWTGATDQDNASALRPLGGFPVIVVGNEFEAAIPVGTLASNPSTNLRLRIAASSDDTMDLGLIVGPVPGAFVVSQRPLTDLMTAPTAVLELRMRAVVADVQVASILVDQDGGGTVVLPALPITIRAGEERVEQIVLDPEALPAGAFVRVELADVVATTQNAASATPTTISGDGAKVYVQTRPAGIVVDGLFDDWTGPTLDPVDPVPASVDLRESAFAIGIGTFYYVQVRGNVLAGVFLPDRRTTVPEGPYPPTSPGPLARIAGEDRLRIYVDTDTQDGIGAIVDGVVADRYVEVRGRLGRITSGALRAWDPTTSRWEARIEPFAVAFAGSGLEASTGPSFLAPTPNMRIAFAMSDWSGRVDVVETATLPMPLLSGPSLLPLHATMSQNIEAGALTAVPSVDGLCATTPDEYDGAGTYGDANIAFAVGRRDDSQFLFLCIEAKADTSENQFDFGWIFFDTSHNGGSAPQPDDRWFSMDHSNRFGTQMGTGTGWGACTACDPGDTAANAFVGFEQYEFKIRYVDVWGTNAPSPSAVAGFAIVIQDRPAFVFYRWGSDAVDQNVPDTWGHLSIPEFDMPALAAAIAAVVIAWRRRGRGRTSA